MLDVLMSLFIGYNLVEFAPNAFVNLVLILKEATLKQFAFTKSEDYEAGKLFNGVSIDLL